TDLGADVHLIDTRMGGYDSITAAYLIRSDRPALVETGAARSAEQVIGALSDLGIGPDDLATLVVTHIHLDHAGGVGDLAAAFPRAEVVVHERGARHLVEPGRLLASARSVFGDVLDTVFGDLLPTPVERVRALGNTGVVDLGGGRRLTSTWSPGHAHHHVGLLDSLTGDLYVGDAAGIYVPEADLLRPATPPPDFDLQLALASLEAFSDLQPRRLLFSHFGPVDAVEQTLAGSAEELELWVERARETRDAGLDLDHAVAAVRERTAERYAAVRDDPALREKHELLAGDAFNLSGVLRWLDRVEPREAG
ncbi:MAG: beta-lactamase domain protein, partial [Frankiales bacterium]|nr:beta-lactamase domain protein [Frankiales bacterium]